MQCVFNHRPSRFKFRRRRWRWNVGSSSHLTAAKKSSKWLALCKTEQNAKMNSTVFFSALKPFTEEGEGRLLQLMNSLFILACCSVMPIKCLWTILHVRQHHSHSCLRSVALRPFSCSSLRRSSSSFGGREPKILEPTRTFVEPC